MMLPNTLTVWYQVERESLWQEQSRLQVFTLPYPTLPYPQGYPSTMISNPLCAIAIMGVEYQYDTMTIADYWRDSTKVPQDLYHDTAVR